MLSEEKEALIGRVFQTYLTEHHKEDILQLIANTYDESHHPVFVNAMTLFEASMEVGDYFNAYPSDVLDIFEKELQKKAMELSAKEQKLRHILHPRITGLPLCPELTRDTIPRSRDVGHFLSVTGTVIRTSVTKVLEYKREYICTKCRHVFNMHAEFDQHYTFTQSMVCPNPYGCSSIKFTCLSGGSEPTACKDYQEIKIQEQVQRLSVGSIPRSLVVVLEDDLVDSCKSGDDVTIYGVMCQRWKPFYDGSQCNVELVLRANNIEVNNQQAVAALVMKDAQQEFEEFWNSYRHDPIAGRNQILLSLCPQVFGMYLIKLAMAMVLAGGVQRIDSSGTKIRGECHMLLVGDPGTGKSQFLKYAARIIPRSVLTAGIGSTNAGLTVAAVKDGPDWHLEAGALVLSDGGLCCIDEFNSIKEHDRISIHEAMEQQSISVAKAGMVCRLNTRTTILAATNPKGKYDPNEPLSINVALPSPLLSRFDVVLLLMDNRNHEWDTIISSFILNDRGQLFAESDNLWSLEKIKAYFSVIKCLKPQVSGDANSILMRYYQLQRQRDRCVTARTTIRMLESLSRLAEAHSRLMYRETVTIEDAVMAVSVMECSMQGGALLGNVNALLTSFPANPREHYQALCQKLLEGLNLQHLLQKEMGRLARLKRNTSDISQQTDKCNRQLGDMTPVNKSYLEDITSNPKDDGLNWFDYITPSLPQHGLAPPIITSTQEPLMRKTNFICSDSSTVNKEPTFRTERNTDSTLNATVSYAFGTTTSGSEDLNQVFEKSENMEKKNPAIQEAMKTSERLKDKNSPESLEYVSQNVPKNRRLGEMEPKHPQCDKVQRGRHGDSVRENVNAALDVTSEDNVTSGQEGEFFKEDKKDQTDTVSAGLQQRRVTNAESREKQCTNLSNFIFKPRKMKSLVHNLDSNSQFQSESSRGIHTDIRIRKNEKKPISKDESKDPLSAMERNKRLSQYQTVSEGGSIAFEEGDSRFEASTCFTTKDVDKDAFLSQMDTIAQDNPTIQPIQPITCINNPEPSTANCTKSTVVSSTLSKLSKFSFISTTMAEVKCKESPLKQDNVKCLRVTSKDQKNMNPPEESPLGKKILSGNVKGVLSSPVTELTSAQKHEQGTELPSKKMCKFKGQLETVHSPSDNTSIKTVNNDPVDYQNAGSLKKRKSCEDSVTSNRVVSFRSPLSGLSLFGSTELGNDVLDTDWDQEVSKKAKI